MLRFISAAVLLCAMTIAASAQEILGSGSTFSYPVMVKLGKSYEKASGAHILYQPIGSAAGIIEIRHEIVDFALSEAPLESEQLLRDGLGQFPLVIGAIVPVVNLDGIAGGQLHFTGPVLADIFLGKITKWNDPAIAQLNPDLRLPSLAITVVHRSDGSGTTFNWAYYLSSVSAEWKVKVGVNTTVAWPTGVGGKGNGGVADKIAKVRGALGYIDYPYVARGKLTYGLIRNRAGNFVVPDAASFQAATVGVDWTTSPDFYVLLSDAAAADAFPIMATSFVIVRKFPHDLNRARDMRAFFRWALENGRDLASALGYLPLPASLVQQIESEWAQETTR